MGNRPAGCIGDETLESYSLNRLSGAGLAAVEEHLLVCTLCQDRLREPDAFVEATRRTLQNFDAPR